MTWIIDDNGRRWVDYPDEKRRNPPRALRFSSLKVGDQIMQKPRASFCRGLASYYLVTDLWFDPVTGQDDPLRGQMVGFASIRGDGTLGRKTSTTIRGLASQQYVYADRDYLNHLKVTTEAIAEGGGVVGIGHARVLRSRPKIAGL